jgi:hypothetical protein
MSAGVKEGVSLTTVEKNRIIARVKIGSVRPDLPI